MLMATHPASPLKGRFGLTRGQSTTANRSDMWPPRGEAGAPAALALDFEGGRYWWGGAARTAADLTVAGGSPVISGGYAPASGDKLNLPASAIAALDPARGTWEVEWDIPTTTAGGFLLSLDGSASSTRSRFELTTASDGTSHNIYISYYNGTSPVTVVSSGGPYLTGPDGKPVIQTRRRRELVRYADGDIIRIATAGRVLTAALNGAVYGVAPAGYRWSGAGIGYQRWSNAGQYVGGNIKRMVYWAEAASDAFLVARSKVTTRTNLHLLGDSFATPALGAAIASGLTPDYRAFQVDGVGGSTLSQQAARWAATPQSYDPTLIIMDGSGPDEDIPTVYLPKLAEIVGRLTHGRWLYVQGGINSAFTPAQVEAWKASFAEIAAILGDHFVPSYDWMRSHGGGATVGSGGGEVWAANNYDVGDVLHPGSVGKTNLGLLAANAILERGW